MPEGGRVQYIEPSPHRKGSAYYAVYRWLLGDYQPYIYRTDDYGKTWASIASGLPGNDPARVVRENPNQKGMLVLGTDAGFDALKRVFGG